MSWSLAEITPPQTTTMSSSPCSRINSVAELVDDRTRLVSVAWVSHQNGYHHDLAALAELAHSHGAYLYADAMVAARDEQNT